MFVCLFVCSHVCVCVRLFVCVLLGYVKLYFIITLMSIVYSDCFSFLTNAVPPSCRGGGGEKGVGRGGGEGEGGERGQ